MSIIYKITNKLNGKIYVGKSKYNMDDYFGSGIIITHAIKKYGIENFTKEIIVECDDAEIDELEGYWIEQLNARDKSVGYNISSGGQGGDHYWKVMSDEEREQHREKIRKSTKGRKRAPHSEETKRKMSRSFDRSPEFLERRAAAKRKKYIIIDHYEKKVFNTSNLKEFCQDNDVPSHARLQHNERNKKTYVDGRWSCRMKEHYSMDDVIEYIENEIIKNTDNYKNKMSKSAALRTGEKNPNAKSISIINETGQIIEFQGNFCKDCKNFTGYSYHTMKKLLDGTVYSLHGWRLL